MMRRYLKNAAEKFKDKKPLIHAIDNSNIDILAPVIKESGCPVVVRGKRL
jgi:CO dehydrogenase/acetyl-CoA synthase gamma subunit (corrinoid Fe-S protein)